MGAETFFATATGSSARSAFLEAVDQARHWHGHGGYTGTIAEKRDFVLIRDAFDAIVARARAAGHGPFVEGLLGRMELTPERRAAVTAHLLIQLADPRVDDKWGPAGCIEVPGTNLYLFFGWASS